MSSDIGMPVVYPPAGATLMQMTLETPLSGIKGIGPRMLAPLRRLGLLTVRDLLWHFPARYDDFAGFVPIAELEPGSQVTIAARVESVETRRSYQRKLTITEAELADESGTVHATWFQPYMATQLTPGTFGYFAGKVTERDGVAVLNGPVFERVRPGSEQRHTGRLVPIYPETRGITSRGLRYLIKPILEEIGELPDALPPELAEAQGFVSRLASLEAVHFPDSREQAEVALERFAFEDLFLLQLSGALDRHELAQASAPEISIPLQELQDMVAAVPFVLTASQKAALWDAVQDLARPHPMNRLVQGDVGSGKTVVAALAAHLAARAGYQAAIMAPTDLLARQHFATLVRMQSWLEGTGSLPSVALLSGSHGEMLYPEGLRGELKPPKVRAAIASGQAGIVIGTHALISDATSFARLGLVVIDEQHRFGVAQRKALAGAGALVPHLLSMTATPIPRTIMLTVFGELSTSLITEMPAGRQPVRTLAVGPADRDRMYREIDGELSAGRQAFFVCPLIEHAEPDATLSAAAQAKREALAEARSVAQAAEHVRAALPHRHVSVLHGKMKPAEKAEVMQDFVSGAIDVLVCTTVIEVGVDVPNATVMAVESADRFGLAQLHQLRGRIGRGGHAGTCYLIAENAGQTARKRLEVLVRERDGFKLAERDLALRGPGEFLGASQSGMPDLAMRYLGNARLVARTQKAAREALASGIASYPDVARELQLFRAGLHQE